MKKKSVSRERMRAMFKLGYVISYSRITNILIVEDKKKNLLKWPDGKYFLDLHCLDIKSMEGFQNLVLLLALSQGFSAGTFQETEDYFRATFTKF